MHDDEVQATTIGLLQCLRMLAEEASILHLDRTFAAPKGALDTCNLEVSDNLIADPFEPASPGVSIH
jgi:hypothetical protein